MIFTKAYGFRIFKEWFYYFQRIIIESIRFIDIDVLIRYFILLLCSELINWCLRWFISDSYRCQVQKVYLLGTTSHGWC